MNPLLSALVAAGVIDQAEAQRLNRMLNDDAARAWAEQQVAVAIGRGLNAQQTRLLTALNESGAGALLNDTFWRAEVDRLGADVLPTLRDLAGERALVAVVRSGDLNAWRTVNEAVVGWVDTYYTSAAEFGSIPNLNRTARQEVAALVNAWQRGTLLPEGERRGLPDLISAMDGVFGAERGSVIAVTEVSRVFAESTRQAALANPAITRLRWLTGRDEVVCKICGPLDGATIAKGERAFTGGFFPPAHPGCRCSVAEETDLTMAVPVGEGGAGQWTYA